MAITRVEPGGAERYVIHRHLETVGDGTGEESGVGDFSVTPRVLRMDVQDDERIEAHTLVVHIQDAGNFDPSKYGVLSALTNGISVGLYRKGVLLQDILDGRTIKDHGDWAHYGLSSTFEASAGSMMFTSRLELVGGTDDGWMMYPGDDIRVTLNDNFTGIDDHDFILHGRRIPA